jgi:hypothetical protein
MEIRPDRVSVLEWYLGVRRGGEASPTWGWLRAVTIST